MGNKVYYIFFSLMVFGCISPKSRPEIVEYINDEENNLKKEVYENDIKLSLAYYPSDIVAAHEIVTFNSSQKRDSVISHYKQYMYFLLSMSKGDEDLNVLAGTDVQFYHYLNQELGGQISGKADGNKLELLDFMHFNLFGSTGKTEILLAFKNEITNSEVVKLIINTGPLGLGIQSFEFKTKDMINVPKLKLKF